LTGLSELNLEWNHLEIAEQYAAQALEIEQSYADEQLQIQSSTAMARAQHARGESEQARQRLLALVAQIKSALPLREVEAYQARLNLAAGDLAAVRHWYATRPQPGDRPHIQEEQQELVAARLFIAQGNAKSAIHQLEGWLAEAQEDGQSRSVLEIKILLALAHASLGDQAKSRELLIQALARSIR
jgi:LuxR family maltose regulon positive regulatory protein